MALIEDVLKKNPVPVVGLAVAALAFPFMFPSLRPQWAALVKSGVKLFFEAEGGAEATIIDRIAEEAIDRLADAIARDTPKARQEAVAETIADYKRRAQVRSQRTAWDRGDRKARYRRHIAKLRRAVSRRHAAASGHERKAWEKVVAHLDHDHPADRTSG